MLNKFNKSGTDVAIILSITEMIILIIVAIKYVKYGSNDILVLAMTIYVIVLGLFIVAKLKLKKDPKFLARPVYGGLLIGFITFVILHIISTMVSLSVNMNMDYGWVGFFIFSPFFLIIFTLVGMFLGFIYSIVKKHLLS